MYILLILALVAGVLGDAFDGLDALYTRQYLRGIPEMARKQAVEQKIERIYRVIIQPLTLAAIKGETKYAYSMSSGEAQGEAAMDYLNDELLEGLKEKFPECAVSYQEGWVKTARGVKEYRKGILIDWS